MAYSSTETEYNNLYAKLQRDAQKQVVKYVSENWHPIKDEWVMGLKASCGSFLNTTNNRLESINGKLKQVISRHSSLEDFISSFFVILTALRTERDHKAVLMFQKVVAHPFPNGSAESNYLKCLTSYAASYVIKQLELTPKVNEIEEKDGQYVIHTSQTEVVLNLTNCSCIFRNSMLLPCRHMFALRLKLGETLFDPSLCDRRWTYAYYRATQKIFINSSIEPSFDTVESSSKGKHKLSQHEKYRKASLLTSELASVASGASHVHFDLRLQVLKDLIVY